MNGITDLGNKENYPVQQQTAEHENSGLLNSCYSRATVIAQEILRKIKKTTTDDAIMIFLTNSLTAIVQVVSRGGFYVGNGINWKGQVFSKMRNHTVTNKMTVCIYLSYIFTIFPNKTLNLLFSMLPYFCSFDVNILLPWFLSIQKRCSEFRITSAIIWSKWYQLFTAKSYYFGNILLPLNQAHLPSQYNFNHAHFYVQGVGNTLKRHYETYLLEYELAHDDVDGECCLICHRFEDLISVQCIH